jgi:hypothetical protein
LAASAQNRKTFAVKLCCAPCAIRVHYSAPIVRAHTVPKSGSLLQSTLTHRFFIEMIHMRPEQMPLNQTIVVAQTDVFRSTATRVSSSVVELVYQHQPTNDVVLKVSAQVDGSSTVIEHIDPVFWNITIDDRPATEEDLGDITRKKMVGVTADGVTRKLNIRLPE